LFVCFFVIGFCCVAQAAHKLGIYLPQPPKYRVCRFYFSDILVINSYSSTSLIHRNLISLEVI
jgi:hypothetical protein